MASTALSLVAQVRHKLEALLKDMQNELPHRPAVLRTYSDGKIGSDITVLQLVCVCGKQLAKMRLPLSLPPDTTVADQMSHTLWQQALEKSHDHIDRDTGLN